MPTYSYVAKDRRGKTVKGKLAAINKPGLVSGLHERDLFLVSCEEEHKAFTGRRMSAKRLAEFNLQLGTMLSSGITLAGAIEIMLMRDLAKRDRVIYEELYDHLLSGLSLAEAARELGSVFPRLLISMYVSGEANGTLDTTCISMAEHYLKEQKLVAKIKSAMTYPIVLFVLLILVVIGIFTFILPRFLNIYGDMELPKLTEIIIAFSKLFTDYWLYTLIGVLGLVFIVISLYSIPSVRLVVDRAKLRMPVIGKLLRIIATARFARTLASLYSTGITITNALEISRGTVGNAYIASQFEGAITDVQNGNSLSSAIKKIDGYDPKLASTIVVGEETGKLDTMLRSVADSFEFEADEATTKLTTIIEPVMICIMAVVILFIMLGVMLPIYSLYESIDTTRY